MNPADMTSLAYISFQMNAADKISKGWLKRPVEARINDSRRGESLLTSQKQ